MFLLVLAGCSDDEDPANKAGFEVSSKIGSEGDATVLITVKLVSSVDKSTALYFEVAGNAALNGDYRLVTPSPVNIEAGAKEAVIKIELLNESIIESSENIALTLTAASSGIVIDESKNKFVFTIEDNDKAPAEGIQIDITWSSGSVRDIDEFNLDLYIANNVAIVNNVVESYNLFSKSENSSGFESVWLPGDAPDGKYYIVVYYMTGSEDVDYAFAVNGPGFTNKTGSGGFTATEVGHAMFYGPLSKSGSVISRSMIGNKQITFEEFPFRSTSSEHNN